MKGRLVSAALIMVVGLILASIAAYTENHPVKTEKVN